ncbi:MAG TPA: hypothetical protein VM536_12365, partial [Chloroflexia bacterium]|nr:hypothetical protein [Chloroflexia bacterium]
MHLSARRTRRTFPIWIWGIVGLMLLALGPLVGPLHAAESRFVTVEGSRLAYAGQPVRLKGVSFYPSRQPWADMWRRWDGPAARSDLARMADFGANTVRVLLPFREDLAIIEPTGAVRPVMLDRLRQLVQMAGEQHLKVIITLFDWYDDTPAASDARW